MQELPHTNSNLVLKRFLIIIFIGIGLLSCETKRFNQSDSDQIIQLDTEALIRFNQLKKLILRDLKEIREISSNLTVGDTTYLSTNSHYLYQIDKASYFPIIEKLKGQKVFIDRINTTSKGVLYFTLKTSTDNSTQAHIQYTHELIWGVGFNTYSTPYSRIIDVKKDSLITNHWRYIYLSAYVGH